MLLKKDHPFLWMTECTEAVDTLISIVTSNLVLHRPDHERQFELKVNALQFAIGTILYQCNAQGRQQPMAYHSETLNKVERSYNIYD
jgi:RNase H-like domain found in reverse transcriptase